MLGAIGRQVCRLRRLADPTFYRTVFPRLRRFALRFDARYTPIYVCGVAGSGNTVLAGLLHQRYASAALLAESALWMPPGAPLRIEKVLTYGTLERFRAAIELPEDTSVRSIRRSSLRLYRHHTELPKRSSFVIDKGPNVHMVRAAWLKRAFPDAKLILVHRDPAANIEGLRRKWPEVFGRAELRAVCRFWEDLHEVFLRSCESFADDVAILSYDSLIEAPERCLDSLVRFSGLSPRSTRAALRNRPDERGKGLRNVVDGEIRLVRDADERARASLPPEDLRAIEDELAVIRERLAEASTIP